MRLGPWLLLWWPLVSCRLVVEPDVTYRDCDLSHYEEALLGSSLEAFFEHCWRLDSAGVDPADVFVDSDDGDVVMIVNEPTGMPRAQWLDDDRGPLLYQRIAGDFLIATRVEAIDLIEAEHCLDDGNMAGLAARAADAPGEWATLLIGPYDGTKASCLEGTDPPAQAIATSRSWGPPVAALGSGEGGVGTDGDVDIALCRFGADLRYFYYDSMADPPWQSIGSHEDTVAGPMDVGLTVAGRDPNFSVEGHFSWVAFEVGKSNDNCRGALDALVVPENPP